VENEETSRQVPKTGISYLWLLGGCALSVTTLFSIALLVLLLASVFVNAYLAWTMSGYEVAISRPTAAVPALAAVAPTSQLAFVPPDEPTTAPTAAPTATPTLVLPTATAVPTDTPTPVSTPSQLESEFATLAALATQVAESEAATEGAAEATSTPTPTPAVMVADLLPEAGQGPAPPAESATDASVEAAPDTTLSEAATGQSASSVPLPVSTNSYDLIPIEGEREIRPADEHADLNLKLRDPQPVQLEPRLVDINGAGGDPNAPQLSSVFKPDFVATYAVHNWDWGCNCMGTLDDSGRSVLVGIRTTPGQPVFIPTKGQDIYQGKYQATVLYASEDSLTFVYTRAGNVVRGYTVHYLGLQVDPNLVSLFRQSRGNELPGLTLDVPVGVATDKLIVGIRDNGTFMDARSRLDWWR
jgi:hypothetical protein